MGPAKVAVLMFFLTIGSSVSLPRRSYIEAKSLEARKRHNDVHPVPADINEAEDDTYVNEDQSSINNSDELLPSKHDDEVQHDSSIDSDNKLPSKNTDEDNHDSNNNNEEQFDSNDGESYHSSKTYSNIKINANNNDDDQLNSINNDDDQLSSNINDDDQLSSNTNNDDQLSSNNNNNDQYGANNGNDDRNAYNDRNGISSRKGSNKPTIRNLSISPSFKRTKYKTDYSKRKYTTRKIRKQTANKTTYRNSRIGTHRYRPGRTQRNHRVSIPNRKPQPRHRYHPHTRHSSRGSRKHH